MGGGGVRAGGHQGWIREELGDACAADQRPGRRRAFAGAGLERGSGRGLIEEHLRLPIWRSVSVSQNSWFVVIRSPRVGWQSGWQRSGKSDPMKKHPTLKCRARTRSGCPCQKSPVAGKKTGVGFTVVGRRVPRRPKARPPQTGGSSSASTSRSTWARLTATCPTSRLRFSLGCRHECESSPKRRPGMCRRPCYDETTQSTPFLVFSRYTSRTHTSNNGRSLTPHTPPPPHSLTAAAPPRAPAAVYWVPLWC